MPTESEDLKLPTQPGSPTSEHGQMMFAMGKMLGRLDAIDQKQAYANGRTGKLAARMDTVEKWQNTTDGQDKGISKTWAILYAIAGLVVGALGVYFTIRR